MTLPIKTKPIFTYPPFRGAETQSAAQNAPPPNVENVTLVASSRFGQMLEFNGTSSKITLGPLPGKSAVTVALWVKKFVWQGGASPGLRNPICFVARTKTQAPGDKVEDIAMLQAGMSASVDPTGTAGKTVPLDAGWSQVTIVFEYMQTRMYINGELRGTYSPFRSEIFGVDKTMISIGYESWGKSFFLGQIAQLEVFDSALTAGDIRELAKPRPPVPITHVTLGNWSYDEVSRSSLLLDAAGKVVKTIGGKAPLVQDPAFDQGLHIESIAGPPFSIDQVLLPALGTVSLWCKVKPAGNGAAGPLMYAKVPSQNPWVWQLAPYESNEWVHYAMVLERDEFNSSLYYQKIYKNGQLLEAIHPNNYSRWGLKEPEIGELFLGSGLVGELAHLMIFDVALSAEGIGRLFEDTRLLSTTASTLPVRQKTLLLGGKDGNKGILAATKGQEFADVSADIYIRGKVSNSYSSRVTELKIDFYKLDKLVLWRSSDKWLLCMKNVSLTEAVAGLSTVDVEAPAAGDGFEIEIRYDVVERPATRTHTLTLKSFEEKTISASAESIFVSGQADVYLWMLFEPSAGTAALWRLGSLQMNDRGSAKPGSGWVLVRENVDLTTAVKYQRSLKIATNYCTMLRLKFDVEELQVTESKGEAVILNSKRSTTISAPAGQVFRAGKANLYIRGDLGDKGEYVNAYVGGDYVGRFSSSKGSSDWELIRADIPLDSLVDGLASVDLYGYPAGDVVSTPSAAGCTWELKLEYTFACTKGQATRASTKLEIVSVSRDGIAEFSFKGNSPSSVIFQSGMYTKFLGDTLTVQRTGESALANIGLKINNLSVKATQTGRWTQLNLPLAEYLGKGKVFACTFEPEKHFVNYQYSTTLRFRLGLAFDWHHVDEFLRRVKTMQTNTEEISSRIAVIDKGLEFTVEKLELSKNINDGLIQLEKALTTVWDLLRLAALIPPIKGLAQKLRDTVNGFRTSVTKAREASDRVESTIKPIREKLADAESKTTKILQTCERATAVEGWSMLIVDGAKQCVANGEYTENKVTAAKALESACKGMVPIVVGLDTLQTLILAPCRRVEDTVEGMRNEIDRLGTIETCIRRTLDDLKPLLSVLREIEKAMSFSVDFGAFEISIQDILDAVDKYAGLILNKVLEILQPILDRLNLNLSFDIPGLDQIEVLGLGLDLDFKAFDVEWLAIDALRLKWETNMAHFEKNLVLVKNQYPTCCGKAAPVFSFTPRVT